MNLLKKCSLFLVFIINNLNANQNKINHFNNLKDNLNKFNTIISDYQNLLGSLAPQASNLLNLHYHQLNWKCNNIYIKHHSIIKDIENSNKLTNHIKNFLKNIVLIEPNLFNARGVSLFFAGPENLAESLVPIIQLTELKINIDFLNIFIIEYDDFERTSFYLEELSLFTEELEQYYVHIREVQQTLSNSIESVKVNLNSIIALIEKSTELHATELTEIKQSFTLVLEDILNDLNSLTQI